MKNKKDPWTVQQRFGFQDDDLKNPNHDEIMIWLDKNIDTIIAKKFSDYYLDEWRKKAKKIAEVDSTGEDFNVDIPPNIPKVIEKIWEYVITNGNFTIGFVDFVIQIEYPMLNLQVGNFYHGIKKEDEKYKHSVDIVRQHFAFEIKTVILSLGELIRQIRMYETYLFVRHTRTPIPIFVVSADDRYAKILESQNIGFIKYE